MHEKQAGRAPLSEILPLTQTIRMTDSMILKISMKTGIMNMRTTMKTAGTGGTETAITTRRKSRRRSGGGVPLAAPIRKGGRLLSRLSSALLRQLSLILIIATAVYVTYTFWRASAPYGDIMESVRLRSITYTLAAYLSVAALFLLFEFISLIWAMTRVRVHNGKESWKEDTGRGLFSFIAVFTASYASFLFCSLLPDTPDVIYGLKGALTVYGSMHNVLLGLCAAGVISCLIRKYKSS